MLNLKKGLALVLAAATAFTFAPVANLGSAVQAEAANNKTLNLSVSGGAGSVSEDYSDLAGYYVVTTDTDTNKRVVPQLTVSAGGNSVALAPKSDRNTANFQVINPKNGKTYVNFNFTYTSGVANDTYVYHVKQYSAPDNTISAGSTTVTSSVAGAASAPNSGDVLTITVKVTGVAEPQVTLTSSGIKASEVTNYGNSTYSIANQTKTSAAFVLRNAANTGDVATALADWTVSSTNKYLKIDNLAVTGNVATVDVTGLVAGTDTIVASAKVGTVTYSKSFTVKITQAAIHFTRFDWTDLYDGKTAYLTGFRPDGLAADNDHGAASSVELDTVLNKTLQLNVATSGNTIFQSTDTSVATVSDAGLITAVKPGTATVKVYSSDDLDHPKTLTVYVTDNATDAISTKVDGKEVTSIELDPSNSTAETAVKSAKIVATSKGGLTLSSVLANNAAGTGLADSQIATLSSDGVVTAGTKTGTVYVVYKSATKGNIKGNTKVVKVDVVALPKADIQNFSDIVLDLNKNKTYTLAPTSKATADGAQFTYSFEGNEGNIVQKTGNVITANKIGQVKLTLGVTPTTKTRYTTKTVKVTVVENAAKAVSDLKVASSALTVAVGKTVSAGASTSASGAAITYASDNEKVATVAADGTIKAVAPGTAVVTVKAAETDTVNAGVATIVVTVPQNPAKVAGLKVANKKGAKVSVSWKSQGGSISYRVYKKVGNGKWVAKNVTSNKATLSVKKGAKVQVKVKAFVKDSTGKTTWGPKATKVTKTTDKK